MNIAVILAGGVGRRLGNDLPKQFLLLGDKSIIEHSVTQFELNPHIDEIVIVSHEKYIKRMEDFIPINDWKKVKHIIKGGSERYESCWAAIKKYESYPEYNLIFHDAVRPLVSQEIIDQTIFALNKFNAAGVCIPATDTLFVLQDGGEFLAQVPDRTLLRHAQTPQGFKQHTIRKAYEIALLDSGFTSSDDCGIVRKYLPEEPIYMIPGAKSNIKLTHKEDLFILEKLYKSLNNNNFSI